MYFSLKFVNMASETYAVDLYIYDLTRGMASQLAPMLMGSGLNLGKYLLLVMFEIWSMSKINCFS